MKLSHLAAALSAQLVAPVAAGYLRQDILTAGTLRNTTVPAAPNEDLNQIVSDSQLLSLHRTICEIESVSNHESTVGEALIKYLGEHDFTTEKQIVPVDEDDDSTDERYNVWAYPKGSPKPKIILTSHIDTVPPHINYSLHAPEGDFDRANITIKGRGTVDAKASVAAMIIAALDHMKESPDVPVGLLFVVSEERGGTGMIHFSDSELNTSPPFFHTLIFGEPTELKLVDGHKGNLRFDVEAKGVSAHSGYPWLGHSAISEILPVLARIDGLGDIPVEDGGLPSSEKYGSTTLNIGTVRGGAAGNVVPESASASVAVRLADGTVEDAQDIIRKAVADASGGSKNITLKFPDDKAYPPIDLDTDVDGFELLTVNYGTDIPKLDIHDEDSDVKVKRYLYGPGTILVAHGVDEGLTVGDLEKAVEGYSKLIDAAVKRG
ncbi:acetylornithine deacetylase [Blastomyces gilchristii SLH14081]|uniref:Probable carboxypeptidase BDBG_01803 n=2 Tax=Blastomyces TaxID=229219 RepID=P20D1_BLAGS|nr:acetylornithine deacetylase [Blastomyces gilchristii SLH14081]C5JH24.1 RecName: Full=Probable carboxypeptidase BDBG_01803; AltName: Full=Peptidase M20 domain-containing protein BDBG_01803; Flags: Precursor [Blastomyces gilchristii SLH14081]EGE77193.1 acetylornithine deacetylase [Blastomyces dermatitidis ATCC 18188]OAT05402.1 acetylornithine deacetylase [Blastomyces gilchristii SLH14081]